MDKVGIKPADLAAVGITNQRETTVVWNPKTGKPYYNAIVWQDTRTDKICNEFAKDGGQDRFRAKVGLPLATYFSGPKIKWILDNVPGVRAAAEKGEAVFGNIDTWVIWWLTGGPNGGAHVTDVSNASRTMLMNLETLDWDPEILKIMGIPRQMLPQIRPSSDPKLYGHMFDGQVPVCGDLGDQQAALVGQTCFSPGEAKNTYGTGCFMLLNTGTKPVASKSGLLDDLGLQDRQRAGGLLSGRLDRHHRRPGAVAARQPGADHDLEGDRGLGGDGRGQRRDLLCAGLLGVVCALLEVGRAGRRSSG